MPNTSKYALPFPTLNAAANVPADMQALAQKVEDSLAGNWVPISLVSGYTGTLEVRLSGSRVEWAGTLTRTAGNFPVANTVVGSLPSASYRPRAYSRFIVPGFPSANPNGLLVILSNTSNDITVSGWGVSAADGYFRAVSYSRGDV